MRAIGIVPESEIWEDIEHLLVSGTFIPYPVVVGLAKLSSGTFWTKSGVLLPNGLWSGEGDAGTFSPGVSPGYSGTDADYVTVASEDFIFPARVANISGHALAACYLIFSANTGAGGNSTSFRLNSQMFKMDSSGAVSLLGTAGAGASAIVNSLDYISTYLTALPFCDESDIEENFRIGLRVTLEGKRLAGTGAVEIGWNFHIFDLTYGLLLRSYAELPIRI